MKSGNCLGMCSAWLLLAFAYGAAIPLTAIGAEYNGPFKRASAGDAQLTYRLIVKWRDAPSGALSKPGATAAAAVQKLSAATGVRMKHIGDVTSGLDVVELEQPLQVHDLAGVLATLEAGSDVEFVSPDVWRQPHRVPSDALFPQQWFLQDQQPAATRAVHAWDSSVGSNGTIVAILDTGARFDHPDVGAASQQGPGKSLPGYDFVSPDPGGTFLVANDNNGRDPIPSDPGDWIDSADLQRSVFQQRSCVEANSSWHGTRVSGLVAALTDNGIGVAGLGWNTWLLPVRVLGKCGGFDSDILAALRWSAGLSVSGVPANSFPANVINMSLGSEGACTQATQTVINEVLAQGVVVIASAGNDGGPVDAPASCTGVIAVGAVRHIGTKVGFSNVGQNVTISAPGGNCVNVGAGQPCLFSIDTSVNLGTTRASASSYTDQFNFNVGTSFSAPIVSGAVALMHSANARLTPVRIASRLRSSARAFPMSSNSPGSAECPLPVPTCHEPSGANDIQTCECICTTSTCGAGMLDVQASVAAAFRPAAAIVTGQVSAGQAVNLDGSGSSAACNRTLVTHAWSVAQGSATITNPDQAIASVQAPSSGSFTLRLTVTDNLGATDSGDVTITTSNSTTTAGALLAGPACPATITPPTTPARDDVFGGTPPPGGGGGGGGGGGSLLLELLLLLGLLARRRASSRH